MDVEVSPRHSCTMTWELGRVLREGMQHSLNPVLGGEFFAFRIESRVIGTEWTFAGWKSREGSCQRKRACQLSNWLFVLGRGCAAGIGLGSIWTRWVLNSHYETFLIGYYLAGKKERSQRRDEAEKGDERSRNQQFVCKRMTIGKGEKGAFRSKSQHRG